MIFETKRLIIRPMTLDDMSAVFAYRSDAAANKYQGWIPVTPDDVVIFFKNISPQINVPHTWFQFVMISKSDAKLIGDMGIHFPDPENRQAEIGFTLHKDYQHLGYASEAVGRIITYLFDDLNKHRITASVDPANVSSIRLLQRLGFRKEAHHIESLFINGKWADDVIFAMLNKDRENMNLG